MLWTRMTAWQRTRTFITGTVLLVAAYDMLVIFFGDGSASISRVLLHDATITPIIPFSLGLVVGHLFWPQPPPEVKK